MKRVLPILAALAFSAIAVAVAFFVFRPRMELFRTEAGELRHSVDKVISVVAEGEAVKA